MTRHRTPPAAPAVNGTGFNVYMTSGSVRTKYIPGTCYIHPGPNDLCTEGTTTGYSVSSETAGVLTTVTSGSPSLRSSLPREVVPASRGGRFVTAPNTTSPQR
jgi:hypothetical protein